MSDDFQIFHNGTNSNTYFMDGNSTGGTIIATKDFIVRNQADTQTMIQGIEGGGFNTLLRW